MGGAGPLLDQPVGGGGGSEICRTTGEEDKDGKELPYSCRYLFQYGSNGLDIKWEAYDKMGCGQEHYAGFYKGSEE